MVCGQCADLERNLETGNKTKNWIQVEIDQPSEVENITAAVRSAWDMAKAGAEFDGHCINRLKYLAILAMASDLCIFIFMCLADA